MPYPYTLKIHYLRHKNHTTMQPETLPHTMFDTYMYTVTSLFVLPFGTIGQNHCFIFTAGISYTI